MFEDHDVMNIHYSVTSLWMINVLLDEIYLLLLEGPAPHRPGDPNHGYRSQLYSGDNASLNIMDMIFLSRGYAPHLPYHTTVENQLEFAHYYIWLFLELL